MQTGESPTWPAERDWAGPQSWIRDYYLHSSQDELQGLTPQESTQLAQAHRQLAQTRQPGQALVTLYKEPSGSSTLLIVVDDTSYLVSSVTAQIAAQWGGIAGLIHPTFLVGRDQAGQLVSLESTGLALPLASGDTATLPTLQKLPSGQNTRVESWIAVRLASHLNPTQEAALLEEMQTLLAEVHTVAQDGRAMLERTLDIADSLSQLGGVTLGGHLYYRDTPRGIIDPMERIESVQEFLRWLTRGNFIFMGIKERVLTSSPQQLALADRPGSGLGLLRQGRQEPLVLTGQERDRALQPKPLYITKANSRSRIHRHEYLDYIGIRRFDRSGQILGEYLILGLFSRQAYALPASETPLLGERVAIIRNRLGYQPGSHSDKTLVSIIEDYPRLELFQASLDELTQTFLGIVGLEERRTTRLFIRPDAFGRFITATVFLPRDRYNTRVRTRLEAVLTEAMGADSIDYQTYLSTSSLARIFFRIRLQNPQALPIINHQDLERRLQEAARSWGEATATALQDAATAAGISPQQGIAQARAWAEAAPMTYRADYEVHNAVEDITIFESLNPSKPAAIRIEEGSEGTRIKTYLAAAHTLTELLPIMQNMGLTVIDQKPYQLTPEGGASYWLYDFGVELPQSSQDQQKLTGLYEDALNAYLLGQRESDTLDRLILAEGLDWRQVQVLRAYTHYLVQLGQVFTNRFMADSLVGYPQASRLLARYFSTSFDPDAGFASDQEREQAREQVWQELTAVLDQIPTLDVDRFMRALATVIKATLRTNAYLDRPSLALKVAPGEIDFAPLPRPLFEIYVYSPRVEGVHLRFGKVARGGLRWSDRREDFRTEVLGLVKAQMVKNSVIIPTGAKGGFVPKNLPNPALDRDAWIAEGRESYKVFIASLLDVTDNLSIGADGSETLVRNPRLIARDGDDYYLVVAADKGTASFSDTANAISADYGFWLGDAFASGGSVGYDHKAMGITARGAWESVKRHFAELGQDCQTQEFTAVGIGDMSGDVFGNGLMRSEATRLVAAFDHRDIFLDPNPDAKVSFQERVRLYNLPRSSWADYNPELISEGGGVYSRSAKSVPVSPQVREVLGLEEGVTELAPTELLSAILKAPVDLLYNGGIGTYVKGSSETHAQVGDKANDAIRVDGRDLRARIVGEGGNLGFTQLGRIEAACKGIILNTDAIDNSAGVETSDREVNIKILVDRLVSAGKLSAEERAAFIEAQREEVGQQVLKTNREQNVLLQAERHGVVPGVEVYIRLIQELEREAGLNREVEFLPTDQEIRKRYSKTGKTLTGPELAVLAAYVKIHLTEQLEATDIADDPYLESVLEDYFPPALVERFGDEIRNHPLRKQIICTRVANEMVNLGGITYVFRALEETGVGVDSLARAFYVSRETFGIDRSAQLHRDLPASTPLEGWQAVIRDMQRILDRLTRWFLAERSILAGLPLAEIIDRFKPVTELIPSLNQYFSEGTRTRAQGRRALAESWGLPEELLVSWVRSFEAFALMDVVRIARANDLETDGVAKVYYSVYDRFKVDELLTTISRLPRNDRWETLARSSLRDSLYEITASLALNVVQADAGASASGDQALEAWVGQHPVRVSRVDSMLQEIQQAAPAKDGSPRLAVLQVAIRALRSAVI